MDLSILIIGAGLLFGSLVFSFLVDRLMRRFGVTPAVPEEQSDGFRDVTGRIKVWLRSRVSTDRLNRK